MHKEFENKVAFNGLWPRTYISTAAIKYVLGGDQALRKSRKVDIMADAAYSIFCKDFKTCTGNFLIDDDVV